MESNFHLIWILFSLLLLFSCSAGGHRHTLFYRGMNLKSLPKNFTQNVNANHVTRATFSHNNLTALRSGEFIVFSQFLNIKYMYFDHNAISIIEPDTFVHVPNLRHLELNHNKITEITAEVYDEFVKLEHLNYINLRHNPLMNFDYVDKLRGLGIKVDCNVHEEDDRQMEINSTFKSNGPRYMSQQQEDGFLDELNINDSQRYINGTYEKAFRVHNVNNEKKKSGFNDKYFGSIVFNLCVGFLVLVVLPLVIVIYSCCSRDATYS